MLVIGQEIHIELIRDFCDKFCDKPEYTLSVKNLTTSGEDFW